MTDTGMLNYLWSQALVGGLVAAGVRHAVSSPGARSTPLTLAMLRQAGLQTDIVVDERCAAFLALGMAKASRQPTLLVATSGSAPANWLPAVIEANHAGIPLIVISADRPSEIRDCGANQSIEQRQLFIGQVRAVHALDAPFPEFQPEQLHRLAARVVEQATWPYPGPVHINQPFREPLQPDGATAPYPLPAPVNFSHAPLAPTPEAITSLTRKIAGRRGVIVCGGMPASVEFAKAVTALADQLACPILAEPLSNLRFGEHDLSHLCVGYENWLSDPDKAAATRPEWILRFGAWPVTRHLQNYVASCTDVHALVEPWPRWSDPSHRLTHMLRADPLLVCQALRDANPAPTPEAWRHLFIEFDKTAKVAGHIPALISVLPPETPVFIGNSLTIRQFDGQSGSGAKPLVFYGSRGTSGIDGNISTALGVAAIHGRVVALLGDLATQHDLGGLALAQGRNAVIIAVNNGGGGIFDYLPQIALPEFEIGWRTPQNIDFEHAAKTFGLGYALATDNESLRQTADLAIKATGPHLIEFKVA